MAREKKRLIKAEDLYKINVVSDLRISPSGKQVVYTQQRIDPKTEGKYSNLWILSTKGGKPNQFTIGDHKDCQPRWSPDGMKIAYLSDRKNREKSSQIFVMPSKGGKSRQLTSIDGQIGCLSWSPDGKNILCRIRKLDKDQIKRQEDNNVKKLGVVSRHYQRVSYKLDGEGYMPEDRWHVYRINLNSGKIKQLTNHKIYDDIDPTWLPDGKYIAFLSNHSPDPDFDRDAVDLFIMSSKGGEPVLVDTDYGEKKLPSFSTDGSMIAYLGTPGSKKWYKNQGLWIVPTDGSGKPKQLTSGDYKDCQPRWSPDGKNVAYISDRKNREKSSQIYVMPTTGGKSRQLTSIDGQIGCVSWSPDGKNILCRIRKLDKDQIKRQEDNNAKKLGVVSRHYQRVSYKLDGEGYMPEDRWHVYGINLKSGKVKQLTNHKIYDDIDPTWSPDGKYIAFLSNHSPDPDFDRDAVDLFIMPSKGGEPVLVDTDFGEKKLPSFSPDGSMIAYLGTPGSKKWYKNQGLWIVSIDGSGKPVNLT